MNIGSDVAETGAHRVLSFVAEILDCLLALLLLRVQALPEFVVAFFPSLFSSIQPVAQERHVRVQPLAQLFKGLPDLLVVDLVLRPPKRPRDQPRALGVRELPLAVVPFNS